MLNQSFSSGPKPIVQWGCFTDSSMVKLNCHGVVIPFQSFDGMEFVRSLAEFGKVFCKCAMSGQLCRCLTKLQISLILIFFKNW